MYLFIRFVDASRADRVNAIKRPSSFKKGRKLKCSCIYNEAFNPAGIYLLKVNNRNTRTRCVICSKLTIKTPERCH